MTILVSSQEQDARVQNRFLKWLRSKGREEIPETRVVVEEFWSVWEVVIRNPNVIKEPNQRTIILELREDELEPSDYPEGRKFGTNKFRLMFRADRTEVGPLSSLSGRRIVTQQYRSQSIFEQEQVLSEIDSLLEENSFLEQQVAELQAAIQSLIQGRPELPRTNFRS